MGYDGQGRRSERIVASAPRLEAAASGDFAAMFLAAPMKFMRSRRSAIAATALARTIAVDMLVARHSTSRGQAAVVRARWMTSWPADGKHVIIADDTCDAEMAATD